MTFFFKNRTIFWDISKWNRGQKKWDRGSSFLKKKKKKILKYVVTMI